MRRLLPLVALSALAAAQEDFAMVRLLPLVAVAALAAAQEDFGNMFGQQKYCAPYKCPKEKEAVQNRLSFKAKKGGCDALNSGAGMQMRGPAYHQIAAKGRRASSAGGAMFTPARRNFGPREISPVAFSRGRIKARTASRKGAAAHRRFTAKQSEPTPIDACCDRRQACDSICGTSTKFCDAELKACADKACDDAPDKEECDRKKSMMQLMQSMDQGACKRHTDGQVAACKCVKPDEAPARRLKTIKEVYEKNGGDAAKAEGLAAKADTSKKFGALLHKLVAKYPAMIKKVADPQQEYWEKIMKEGIDKKASDEVVDGAEEDEDVEDLDAVADEL